MYQSDLDLITKAQLQAAPGHHISPRPTPSRLDRWVRRVSDRLSQRRPAE
ncbi:hypothetical protein [Deinococcus rubellus]|uniref:Uncharacterized protein n=1 Tax=Deinococcus rubellus TaxID=1889240 RepID=A0ABY5YKA5_9DEIO|nr:hypothetical protein [Deinococcus rubellus]UWX65553.1 hypothetical protein N0D28_07865 [Deinococcus rubellus]